MAHPLSISIRAVATAGLLVSIAQAQQLPDRVRVTIPAYRQAIAMDTILVVSVQEMPAANVWSAAAKVFYDYKIPTDLRDSVAGTVGATRYVKSTFLANFNMSRVLNCGTSITGPNADNFRINLALVAIVSPSGPARAQLGVGLVGSGVDMRGSSSDPVVCASTGYLEADFADRVRKILKSAP